MEIPQLKNPQTFYESVWHVVRTVPHSFVVTYGQVAQMVDPPSGIDPADYKAFGPRWVGHAMAVCPDDVPWQRVINSQGKVSNWPRAAEQRKRLEAEGVIFGNDKINLKQYQWRGPDEPTQGRLF